LSGETAILAIRNEDAHLGNCLRHLVRNGLSIAIIDNGSTDRSREIYLSKEFSSSIVEVLFEPFDGNFSLEGQLKLKMQIADRLGGDWIVHVDADEMMHTYRDGETIVEGLRRLGSNGWNAVNFDEFVFVPLESDYRADVEEFPELLYYYFFQPAFPRLMRAWRPGNGLSMLGNAGHVLSGSKLKLAPETFALRHYIFRDQAHAFVKYATRTYPESERRRGWHQNRVAQAELAFRFPRASRLKRLQSPQDRQFDKSEPWRVHYWESARATGD